MTTTTGWKAWLPFGGAVLVVLATSAAWGLLVDGFCGLLWFSAAGPAAAIAVPGRG